MSTTFPMPSAPKVLLDNVDYRHWSGFNPRINAFQMTGTDNIKNALDAFATFASTSNANRDVAIDIETKGTDDEKWWQITCITAAFHTHIGVVSILLNPLREPEHRKLLRRVLDLSERIVLHNGMFDIPPLVAHQLITLDDVNKVWDTLVLAKMINTSDRAGRSLEDLAVRYGIIPDDGVKLASVFTASGLGSASEGFARSDIDSGTYRDGAMSDTVVTLRLLHLLQDVVTDRHDAATGAMGARLDRAGATQLVWDLQRVNQIACRRSARGYKIDPEFPAQYRAKTQADFDAAVKTLVSAGLEPGRGDKLVEHLAHIGELPESWPTTKTGRLSADKKAMELLMQVGHPLAQAHRTFADTTKITGYLDKVVDNVKYTGRIHPMIGTLGASATGRMSVTGVELHQFPGDARGILVSDHDHGWSSVDWSSIEPVVMAACAGDNDFLAPFYQGADLYIPIARAAGLIPPEVDDKAALKHSGRDVAKVVLLAGMYGQGKASLAGNLARAMKRRVSVEEASDLRIKIQEAMPVTFAFMKDIERYAEATGTVSTISGRVLDEDAGFTYRAVNHFCQGSAADVLYQSTLEIDRQGLSDHIHLWMHDELVIDTPVADQIDAIMQTPPEALVRWARTNEVKLMTDNNPMGMTWKSV